MKKNLTIGFIGNPNCGKTTLFNAYTGANLKVANWPGVTVERVEGAIKDHDLNIRLVDLPGTYSLTSYTMEEQVSRQFILSDEVDVIIDVADASALERNLYLTLQLLELGKPVVLALNMMDIVEKRGMEIDTHRLPEMLGIPVIPVSARKRTGLDVLLHAAAHHKDCRNPECLIHHHTYKPKHRHDHHAEYAMVYSDAIEDKIDLTIEELKKKYPDLTNYRWHAIKLLEQDKEITKRYPVNLPDVIDRNYESDIINEKYDFIQEIIKEVLVNKDRQDALTEKADRALTHRFWSIPIFLGIMALFVWFFHYMPVGNEAVPELLPTPEQRKTVYERIRAFRNTKPIFSMDFQNDAEYVGGCIAGGRNYLHINAAGDVEPCVFIHYSNVNIHECSLLEALKSPIFMAYRDGQPFNRNMLRPCPMLENPQLLREMVKRTGAKSTDLQSPESVDHLCEKCEVYAKHWKPMADELWDASGKGE